MQGVEAQVAKFAQAGRRDWRTAGIDLAVMVRLPAVQRQLASFEGSGGSDPNADRDAVEGAILDAIEALPDPFGQAAKEHFGFGNSRQPADIEARRERAAKLFKGGRSARWYRKESEEFLGLRPGDYVIALVTAQLEGATDPISSVAENRQRTAPQSDQPPTPEPAAGPSTQQEVNWGKVGVTVASVLGGVAVVAAVAIALVGLLILLQQDSGPESIEEELPDRGTVIDAQSGSWSIDEGEVRLPSAHLEWGDVFRACNEADGPCDESEFARDGSLLSVGPGDTVRFRLRLHNPMSYPVSVVRLAVSMEDRWPEEVVQVTMIAESPRASGGQPDGLGLTVQKDSAAVGLVDDAKAIAYLPGSAALFDTTELEEQLGRLPDGITDPAGIKLDEVGAPEGCWNCDLEYMRFVDFQMRVE